MTETLGTIIYLQPILLSLPAMDEHFKMNNNSQITNPLIICC